MIYFRLQLHRQGKNIAGLTNTLIILVRPTKVLDLGTPYTLPPRQTVPQPYGLSNARYNLSFPQTRAMLDAKLTCSHVNIYFPFSYSCINHQVNLFLFWTCLDS